METLVAAALPEKRLRQDLVVDGEQRDEREESHGKRQAKDAEACKASKFFLCEKKDEQGKACDREG